MAPSQAPNLLLFSSLLHLAAHRHFAVDFPNQSHSVGTVFTRQAAVPHSGTSGRCATSENGSSGHLRGGHLPGLLSTEQTAGGPGEDKYRADLEDNSLPDIPEQAVDL